jgi:hypothetical protein
MPGESPAQWSGRTGVPGPLEPAVFMNATPQGTCHPFPRGGSYLPVLRLGSEAASGGTTRHDKKVVRVPETNRKPSHALPPWFQVV